MSPPAAPLAPGYAPLLRSLPADLAGQFQRTGELPPRALVDTGVALRRELLSIAAFVPYPLVRQQLEQPTPGRVGGAYWQGSVLFADLSGFTALSERLSVLGRQGAEEVSAIINRLFGALVDEVHAHAGALLKFGGDALTAFFDAERLGDAHPLQAAAAALAMQRRMDAFAMLATRAGDFGLRLRVGVHSGHIFAAQVGDPEHIELVVSGHNINRVALAQEIAEPGEVVISHETLTLLRSSVQSEPRQNGFHLLAALPELAVPTAPASTLAVSAATSLPTLLRQAEQIEALRPYLMHGLPRRFIGDAHAAELGEFRPVSVLFANFYPFSNMLAMLGERTELAARVLNAYYCRAQRVIHDYGGVVNKVDMATYGDKLMALFGAPAANEDDPLRATRAALALRAALEEANGEIKGIIENAELRIEHASQFSILNSQFSMFKQRIGINTGSVFAGRVGTAERHEYTVMGPAVNLAARLMGSADEGSVILSPSTRRAVERSIAVQELAPLQLKGLAEPVTPARALRAYEVDRTAAVADGPALERAPLVARDAELVRCLEQCRAALNGAGRVVALVGDAGTGKTRLVEELLHRLVLESILPDGRVPSFTPYSSDCQSYEQRTPYAAARPLLRQLLKLDAPLQSADLGALLLLRVQALAPELDRFTPLLGDLLGQPVEDTPLTAGLSPAQRHDRAQELVEALLRGVTRRQPLVLMIDDLHWADASSYELLARLARAAADLPLLLLLCYRLDPAGAEPWQELPGTLRLALRELSAEGGRALAGALLGGSLPAELAPVLEQTQGNPFFIEELLRTLVATGALAEERSERAGASLPGEHGLRAWHLTKPLSAVALPNSIEGVLTARLDRLGELSRELVQVASVIGRRFQRPVLNGVYGRAAEIDRELLRLSEADILVADEPERRSEAGGSLGDYLFRHTLVRDVAYESILYSRRRELHRRVARHIHTLYGDAVGDQPALLARHYLLAEEWAPAFHYHLLAGRQAQSRYANTEALALFGQALAIAGQWQGSGFRVQDSGSDSSEVSTSDSRTLNPEPAQLVDLHERTGEIHVLIGQYDQALEAFQQALALLQAQPTRLAEEVVRLHRQIATTYERRADFEAAFDWLERGMAQAGSDTRAELTRCYLLGAGIYQRQGKYQQCLEWARMGLKLAERQNNLRDQAKAYKLLSGTYRNLGDSAQAVDLAERSLQLYVGIQDIQEQAGVHNNLGNVLHDLGRWEEARAHYERGTALTMAIGSIHEGALIANNLGDVLRGLGDAEGAIEQYQTALTGLKHSIYGSAVVAMNLGAAYLQRGDWERAAQHLDQSEALFAQAGSEDFMPELLRYRAELALAEGATEQARSFCEAALVSAERLGARPEEGAARRVLGQVLEASGNLPAAEAEMRASLEVLREAGSRYEVARTQLHLADLAARRDQRAEGAALFSAAVAVLRELGARYDLTQAITIGAAHRFSFFSS